MHKGGLGKIPRSSAVLGRRFYQFTGNEVPPTARTHALFGSLVALVLLEGRTRILAGTSNRSVGQLAHGDL